MSRNNKINYVGFPSRNLAQTRRFFGQGAGRASV